MASDCARDVLRDYAWSLMSSNPAAIPAAAASGRHPFFGLAPAACIATEAYLGFVLGRGFSPFAAAARRHEEHRPIAAIDTGRRSFPVAASIIWNILPHNVQSSPSTSTFRHLLKTEDISVSAVISWHHPLTALPWTS